MSHQHHAEVIELDENFGVQIDACCEGHYYTMLTEWDKHQWREFMEIETGRKVRRVYHVDGIVGVDWGIEVAPITWAEAKPFVAKHHRHSKPPVGWKWGHGLRNGDQLIGVVTVGRPVARAFDHTTTVEINRLCIEGDLPGSTVWNGSSMLYGVACREAKSRGFKRVITYTLASECGSSLKASGFTKEAKTKGGTWGRAGRTRTTHNSQPKYRWGKTL